VAIPEDKINLVRETLELLLETSKTLKENMIKECSK